MELVCPSTHPIFFNSDRGSYGDPLSGTIYLFFAAADDPARLSSLYVSLIRTTQLGIDPPPIGKKELPRFKIRLSLRKPKRESHSGIKKSSYATEILRCNLSTSPASEEISPDGNSVQGFEFALSVPHNTPETIETPSSAVSYELMASANMKNGQTFTNCQTLHLSRIKHPDPWDPLTHFRGFPQTKVRAEFVFYPQRSHNPHKHLSALLLLRNVTTPGPRHSELSVVVVKRLTWRVNEIEEWNPQQTDNGTIRRVREVAAGCCKGRWTGMKPRNGNLQRDGDIKDMNITIPYDITIDSSSNPLNDFQVAESSTGSSQMPFLTVRHQLTIDILTGTDTFNEKNGSLVDQRDSVRGFGATMPIPVHEYAQGPVALNQFNSAHGMLPGYEDMSASPPDYRGLFDQPRE